MRWRIAVVALASAAALVPVPAPLVERAYSRGAFPVWQSWITSATNAIPFALLDLLIVAVVTAWVARSVTDLVRRRERGWRRTVLRIAARTAVWSAILYVMFVASWGLNYQRVRLDAKLAFDSTRVSTDAVRALTLLSATRLNALHGPAHDTGWPAGGAVDRRLASAFEAAQRDLGATRTAVPARPKRTWLDAYFRRAVVDGMTDPFFLETLTASDLLAFELPFVTAHEWAHLAGYAHEGEANFVGWLTCLHGDVPQQYSGWLFLYNEAVATLPRRDRAALPPHLDGGPRADLRAIADRVARNASPRVAAAGWRVYNQYLKASGIESGAASYTEVVRLILGTRFGQGLGIRD